MSSTTCSNEKCTEFKKLIKCEHCAYSFLNLRRHRCKTDIINKEPKIRKNEPDYSCNIAYSDVDRNSDHYTTNYQDLQTNKILPNKTMCCPDDNIFDDTAKFTIL